MERARHRWAERRSPCTSASNPSWSASSSPIARTPQPGAASGAPSVPLAADATTPPHARPAGSPRSAGRRRAPVPDATRIEVVPGRVSSPMFVGRIDEQRRLFGAFDAADAGKPTVVLIGGEAGVGKTRLVGVVADAVVARGGRVVTGACLELVDRALPYGPVVQALRHAARTMAPAEFDAVVGSARAELAHLLPELRSDATGGAGRAPGGRAPRAAPRCRRAAWAPTCRCCS